MNLITFNQLPENVQNRYIQKLTKEYKSLNFEIKDASILIENSKKTDLFMQLGNKYYKITPEKI